MVYMEKLVGASVNIESTGDTWLAWEAIKNAKIAT